ncbi:glycosyltransferase [Arthrobacter sp. ATA002]|uniref:glycosyltransferase n=1 Tax=Arthrobacter sp. ATA002 TaxID=2991715 RepID=UPI0022A7571A|nr:glycosyltransferase [Arthrobacter sp. ATA002]WAP52903.1 glycosyltransferase [Arthrobacter sp. ATA002]
MEALASSRPVIFSDIPALHESVRDGIEGISVEAENPTNLANSVAALIGDETLRRRMGAAGRSRVLTQRTWQVAAEQTIAIYERLKVARGGN